MFFVDNFFRRVLQLQKVCQRPDNAQDVEYNKKHGTDPQHGKIFQNKRQCTTIWQSIVQNIPEMSRKYNAN